MNKEVTIILKNSKRKYWQRFLISEDFSLHPDDLVIKSCVQAAQKSFKGEPEDIEVLTLMVVR